MDTGHVGAVLGALALVPAIYGAACPPLATVRGASDDAGHIANSIGAATLTASVAVVAVALGLRSMPVLFYGGAMVAAYAATFAVAREAPPWPG